MSALAAHNMDLHSHNIIYRLAEDIHNLVSEKLPPIFAEEVVGMFETRFAILPISGVYGGIYRK